MSGIARDLSTRGFAVWNLEYRRLGSPGGGWPGTLDDVAAGIGHLTNLRAWGIDLERVAVVGHSAGGHLALWAAGHLRARGESPPAVRIRAAIGLAPIADLARAHAGRVGGEVVGELLGGAPDRYPDRYRAASPIEMLPLQVRQVILHGTADDAVPIELSRRYARTAAAAGDDVELVELAGTGHMEFLDPSGGAHEALCRRLHDLLDLGGPQAPAS